MVVTDLTLQDVTVMVERYGVVSSYAIDSIQLNDQTVLMFFMSPDGQSILVPKTGGEDWGSIAVYISDEMMKIRNASTSANLQYESGK